MPPRVVRRQAGTGQPGLDAAPATAVAGGARPLVVAGRCEPGLQDVAEACERLGWPLLADPLSGARRGGAAIAHYDALLRSEDFTAKRRPDLVVRCGDLPTSKPLRAWLDELGEDVAQLSFDPHGAWQDPGASLHVVLAADGARTLAAAAANTPTADPDWLGAWRAADEKAAAAIDGGLRGDRLSEPLVARALTAQLPPGATLFVASSMPVRDIESFTAVRDDAPRVLCNRGANGIDGTISSAFGAAAVASGPVVLLIGDVALAHDVGGLLAAHRLGLALTIVLIDNDGGGIFEFLPIAGARDAFEEHVATPHGLDFAHAAALYGCAYADVEDRAGLGEALAGALGGDGTTIIRVAGRRAANVALHHDLQAAVAAALA